MRPQQLGDTAAAVAFDQCRQCRQAQQTIQAANNGVTAIVKLVEAAKSLARQARQAPLPQTTYAAITQTGVNAGETVGNVLERTPALRGRQLRAPPCGR